MQTVRSIRSSTTVFVSIWEATRCRGSAVTVITFNDGGIVLVGEAKATNHVRDRLCVPKTQ